MNSSSRLLAAALLAALLVLARLPAPGTGNPWDAGRAWSQGSPREHPMREMMRVRMRGLVPPPGMTAERLPDPKSRGARLLARYCVQCHDMPSPRYKTADQWPVVLDRMLARMNMMSAGGHIEAPGQEESWELLAFLLFNPMIPARTVELQAGNPEDRVVFENACSRCHLLPSPSLHPPAQWPAVVARMEANMQLMGKSGISPAQREAINRFLAAVARPGRPKP